MNKTNETAHQLKSSRIEDSRLDDIAAGGQDGSDLLIWNNGDGSSFCVPTRGRSSDVVPVEDWSFNFGDIK